MLHSRKRIMWTLVIARVLVAPLIMVSSLKGRDSMLLSDRHLRGPAPDWRQARLHLNCPWSHFDLDPKSRLAGKILVKSMVGVTGFEPATPTSRILCPGVHDLPQKLEKSNKNSIIRVLYFPCDPYPFAPFRVKLTPN
jgi:hypothetical protein